MKPQHEMTFYTVKCTRKLLMSLVTEVDQPYESRSFFASYIIIEISYEHKLNIYQTIVFREKEFRKSKIQNNLCFMQNLILIVAPYLCFSLECQRSNILFRFILTKYQMKGLKECRNEASIHNSHSLLSNPHTTKMN